MPSEADRGVLLALMPILKNLHDASIFVQSDQNVSISAAATMVFQMRSNWLQPQQNVDSNVVRDFKLAALQKLDNFFPPFGTASVLLKASALDPRFQLAFLSAREQAATWSSISADLGGTDSSPSVPSPPVVAQADQIVDLEYEDEVLEEGSVILEGEFFLNLLLVS